MNIITIEKHWFTVEKQGKNWKVSTLKYNLKVCEARTKKDVIKQAEQIISEHGGQAGIEKAIDKRKKNIIKTRFFNDKRINSLFESIFKTSLVRFTCPIMYGFGNVKVIDVIALDRFLHTPENISMNDYILKKYGKKALKLVKKLM